jgi:hypothetical protein
MHHCVDNQLIHQEQYGGVPGKDSNTHQPSLKNVNGNLHEQQRDLLFGQILIQQVVMTESSQVLRALFPVLTDNINNCFPYTLICYPALSIF